MRSRAWIRLFLSRAEGNFDPGRLNRSSGAVALICYDLAMTKEVTLRQAGGSVSATLPKDMADRLRLEAGDRILAVETDSGILLTPYDPETERALRVAAKAAKKYRNALRELAK
jgi:putative addiction module antidote